MHIKITNQPFSQKSLSNCFHWNTGIKMLVRKCKEYILTIHIVADLLNLCNLKSMAKNVSFII